MTFVFLQVCKKQRKTQRYLSSSLAQCSAYLIFQNSNFHLLCLSWLYDLCKDDLEYLSTRSIMAHRGCLECSV